MWRKQGLVLGIMGKIFPSYDYTLCDNEQCKMKNTCKRYLTYRKAVEEDWKYRLTIIVPDKPKCDIYVKAE